MTYDTQHNTHDTRRMTCDTQDMTHTQSTRDVSDMSSRHVATAGHASIRPPVAIAHTHALVTCDAYQQSWDDT